jgi:hypothetical protein
MLEDIASSRLGFWIIASLMVAADSSFLLSPGKFAFSVSRSNLTDIRIPISPFLLRNKELVCSLLSFPFQIFFISYVESSERATIRETFIAVDHFRRFARQNVIFSILSVCAIALLILGPCLAVTLGIQTSIVLVFPPFYLLALAASLLLWLRRQRIGLSNRDILKISAEITLCPVLVVNVPKRISLAQQLELNTYRVAMFSNSPAKTSAAISESIETHRGS